MTTLITVRTKAGFTLIELLITLAIVAIMAVISVNYYQSWILKIHRNDARQSLIELAIKQMQFFADHGYYHQDLQVFADTDWPITSLSFAQHYSLTVTVKTFAKHSVDKFVITARARGQQLRDTQCAVFVIDHVQQLQAFDHLGQINTHCL
ncbi:type IV pilin protein [Thalassotalea ponticola]|uniref:type IV pilin protein n=1 Tax=Thalassotalea ponticola TaxID=1523392 RepID=UPI0025B43AAA|nr:type IV pilin protein [Thalassotalea ponticola]MDN3651705.1 type IV pilin protein [Thalassotalea ponticola]